MFNKTKTRVIGVFLSAAMISMSLGDFMVAFADEELTGGVTEEKISVALTEKMQESSDSDILPVWVWFTDIDEEKLEYKVESITGLTKDTIDMPLAEIPLELDAALNDNANFSDVRVAEMLQTYIDDTSVQRNEEKYNSEFYTHTKRAIAADEFDKQNAEIINELGIEDEKVIFQSSLTPSSIINLTKSQILDVIKSDKVVSIDLCEYSDAEMCPPDSEQVNESPSMVSWYGLDRSTMRVDDVLDATGLTGSGVNVLVFDHGWVSSKQDFFDYVNPANTYVVSHKQIFDPVTEVDDFYDPDVFQCGHPNLVTSVLQFFAEDVTVYSVAHDAFSDVEWAIQNCDIDVINGSINFGAGQPYANQSVTKWCDYIINKYSITFIAAGGNGVDWSGGTGGTYIIIPASCYNCIAVGAYESTSDTMHDYRYNPIDSSEYVNYKPDIVVAAGSTSEGTPMATGIVALMLQLKPSLATRPDLIKAILMASCHKKVTSVEGAPSETMEEGLTQRQGAGAIDAYTAISIVLQGKYGVDEIAADATIKDINILQASADDKINVSMSWLYDGVGEIDFEGAPIHNNAYITNAPLRELELDVLNDNQESIVHSERKNTGKQMVYFSPDSSNGQYTIRVTKDEQTSSPVKFAYAWSTASDKNDAIIRKSISVNNALSRQYTLNLKANVQYDTISTNGNITEYKLIGSTSGYNNLSITVGNDDIGYTVLYKFDDILDPEEFGTIKGNRPLNDQHYIRYLITNMEDGLEIYLWDSDSISFELNDAADIVSYYEVTNGDVTDENSVCTRYYGNNRICGSTPTSVVLYDKAGNAITDPITLIDDNHFYREYIDWLPDYEAAYHLYPETESGDKRFVLEINEMGDVNQDGSVNGNDSMTLLRYLIGLYNFVQTGSENNLVLGNGNVTVNGNISSNGTFRLNANNANINGQLSASSFENNVQGCLNMNNPQTPNIITEEQILSTLTEAEMDRMFFSDVSEEAYLDNLVQAAQNINLTQDTVVSGSTDLVGNISISCGIKCDGDINISGEVKNSSGTVLYSKEGDITIDSSSTVNLEGFIYAPNGKVTLKSNNISIRGTIVAKELVIEGDNVNFNVADLNTLFGENTEVDQIVLTEFQLKLSDMDYNELVELRDVVAINRKIHGLPVNP